MMIIIKINWYENSALFKPKYKWSYINSPNEKEKNKQTKPSLFSISRVMANYQVKESSHLQNPTHKLKRLQEEVQLLPHIIQSL